MRNDNGKESGRNPKNGQFKKGNAAGGRTKGSRNKTTLAIESLLAGEGEAITRKAISMALAGDLIALKLCMERILPIRHDRPVCFNLPENDDGLDPKSGITDLLKQVAKGNVTPMEAQEVITLLQLAGNAHGKVGRLNDDLFY